MNITVTKPFLPDYAHYENLMREIWRRQSFSENGLFVREFELGLKKYLNVDHVVYVTNGTVALQLAIKSLGLPGEIITTPFTFVATTSSIVWESCRPVMVDVDPESLNIDPRKIEAAITPETRGILATHVYGNPCDVTAIEAVASKHRIPVIYDAAHGFGTRIGGRSIFSFGDISVASFHATKLFHSIEGGAVFCRDPELLPKLSAMRNFGYIDSDMVDGIGIDGNNCEFHAAMGLANLASIGEILARREELSRYYDMRLSNAPVRRPKILPGCDYNFAYYPVIFESEDILLKVLEELRLHGVMPRRYFYPSLSTLDYVGEQHTPIADDLACRILALPMYHDLSFSEIDLITRVILRTCRYLGET
jgi:dTDP-4-amino-4,6-dideoxygalactose transaminase